MKYSKSEFQNQNSKIRIPKSEFQNQILGYSQLEPQRAPSDKLVQLMLQMDKTYRPAPTIVKFHLQKLLSELKSPNGNHWILQNQKIQNQKS